MPGSWGGGSLSLCCLGPSPPPMAPLPALNCSIETFGRAPLPRRRTRAQARPFRPRPRPWAWPRSGFWPLGPRLRHGWCSWLGELCRFGCALLFGRLLFRGAGVLSRSLTLSGSSAAASGRPYQLRAWAAPRPSARGWGVSASLPGALLPRGRSTWSGSDALRFGTFWLELRVSGEAVL